MQTLSEFRAHWHPLIVRQAKDVAERIEAGEDMSRFLELEPQHRSAVDKLVLEYSSSLSVAPGKPNPRARLLISSPASAGSGVCAVSSSLRAWLG
jgi:hypothetical protein